MNVSLGKLTFEPARECAVAFGSHHFAFLLLEGFSALSYVTAVETLHIANSAAGRDLFTWSTHSENGVSVTSSQGFIQAVEASLTSLDRRTILLVCGGERIERASSTRILGWIRELGVRGCHVGGLCNAAWILAEAGLLRSAKTTIHFENKDSFIEMFPDVELTDRPFVISGKRSATAGGTSAIDLMLEFITRLVDSDLAIVTAERMLYGTIRKLQGNSRITPSYRIGLGNGKISKAIEFFEQNLHEEISTFDVAKILGISHRQLERLFRQHLRQSPKKFLTEMRLDRARRLIVQTEMSILDAATATGFNSASHFSKLFQKRFGGSSSC